MLHNRNKDSDSYLKFLCVLDIIIKNSDEVHPLSVKEIQDKVMESHYDFTVDLRAIKKYVDYYNEFYNEDMIMTYKKGRNNYFYYTTKFLDSMEAKAILDLVYCSQFFTLQTKENYRKKIQSMFSIHYYPYFKKTLDIHYEGNQNDKVFYTELEVISNAIVQSKKITFKYKKPMINDTRERIHTVVPLDTWFSNNTYYLVCQGTKAEEDIILFRMDYIKEVEMVDEKFSLSDYQKELFSTKLKQSTYMYNDGDEGVVELEFSEDIYPNLIDKFGKDIKPFRFHDKYRVQVRCTINSTFYSWVIGFGGKIQIVGSDSQKERFETFLKESFLSEGN